MTRNKSTNILIIGAGAIGRGYIAPLFQSLGYKISFMDKNENLIDKLKRKKYTAAFTLNNKYIFQDVNVNSVFHISDSFDINNFKLVFICVGLREYLSLSEVIKNFKGTCFVLENDELSSQNLRDLTGKKNIFFGIPDVISSNTAPKHLLDLDPLTTVSETGDLVLEKSKFNFQKKILVPKKKKFYEHWICKLFIHNAPHAIVAYLGWIYGYKFIHQAMKDKYIFKIVKNSLSEITNAIIKQKLSTKKFANYYMKKELKRFNNPKLFEPISRVARDPIRKLAPDNRLILSLRMLVGLKLPYKYTAMGIKAAFFYCDKNDNNSLYLNNLIKLSGIDKTMKEISGIEKFDPIKDIIKNSKIKSYEF